jgi:long-chain acyl-CoA synthetase
MSILVTGATGFLGAYVTARLVERGEDVVALVRGDDPQARLDAAAGPGARALAGDLTRVPELPAHVETVLHCAADVSFTNPLAQARAVNVEGTRRLLAAASCLPSLERFVHVSTAYVAGTHEGEFGEADGDVAPSFRNTYEQSKREAERLVAASGLPVRIVRPSIVVGDSRTGWTSSFNVIYAPLQAFARGLIDVVPADPDALVDIVPVDHVADVIDAALQSPEPVLHAVAAEHALTTRALAELASTAFGRPVPRFAAEAGDAAAALAAYNPYFSVKTRFRADRTRALGLAPPAPADYFDAILDYAQRTRWGRRPLDLRAPAL